MPGTEILCRNTGFTNVIYYHCRSYLLMFNIFVIFYVQQWVHHTALHRHAQLHLRLGWPNQPASPWAYSMTNTNQKDKLLTLRPYSDLNSLGMLCLPFTGVKGNYSAVPLCTANIILSDNSVDSPRGIISHSSGATSDATIPTARNDHETNPIFYSGPDSNCIAINWRNPAHESAVVLVRISCGSNTRAKVDSERGGSATDKSCVVIHQRTGVLIEVDLPMCGVSSTHVFQVVIIIYLYDRFLFFNDHDVFYKYGFSGGCF